MKVPKQKAWQHVPLTPVLKGREKHILVVPGQDGEDLGSMSGLVSTKIGD